MANAISLTMATGFSAAFTGVVLGSVGRVTNLVLLWLAESYPKKSEDQKLVHKINLAVNITGSLAIVAFFGASVYLYGFALVNSALYSCDSSNCDYGPICCS